MFPKIDYTLIKKTLKKVFLNRITGFLIHPQREYARLCRIREAKIRKHKYEQSRLIFQNHLNDFYKNEQAIKLVWFNGFANFGDALSPLLVRVLSGRKVQGFWDRTDRSENSLLALGSVICRVQEGDIVWGSGIREGEYKNLKKGLSIKVNAVRGPITRKLLLSKSIFCPEVYGDPSLLFPFIYRPRVPKIFDVGIVRHYFDKSTCKGPTKINHQIIDVEDDPFSVINKICSSKIILSSSLHGIILAEAYGIPALWLRPHKILWSNSYLEPPVKYVDYFLSTSRNSYYFKYNESLEVERAMEVALNVPRPTFPDLGKLLLSFPFLHPRIKKISDLGLFALDENKIEGFSPSIRQADLGL